MQTREWTFCDKTSWGDGPWLLEPDKLQWPDPATGLPCLIVRNCRVTGALCGYVGVTPTHPLHGKFYDSDDVDKLRVHGGLTFAAACRPEENDQGICHIADPGEPDKVWWFGFDCGHSGDLSPRMTAVLAEMHKRNGLFPVDHLILGETYRDLAYVKAEVAKLALQLAGQS